MTQRYAIPLFHNPCCARWIAALAVAFCVHATAFAQTTRFVALATGGQEVPPVATTTVGLGVFDVNAAETAMLDFVLAARLTDGNMAHIHCAPIGVNGPVGVTLYNGAPITIPGTGGFDFGLIFAPDGGNGCGWTTLDDAVSAMLAGQTYMNIHTLANPTGEVRGKIFPPSTLGADCTDPPNLVPGADLRNCGLDGANLANAHLEGANLITATLTDALVEGSFLRNADMRAADFSDADLFEIEFDGADGRYAILRNVNLEASFARGADLRHSDFSGSDLFFIDMIGADLRGADLSNTEMGLADLRETDLRDANLLGAHLGGAHLSNVVWGNTICPDGTNSDADDGDGFTCESNL